MPRRRDFWISIRQCRLLLRQFVKLVQLGLQELLLGQPCLVFGDEGRRGGTAQGTDEAEVAAQFDEKLLQMFDQAAL